MEIMARESIDALLARLPVNTYYLSNYRGQFSSAGGDDGSYWVIIPRDPQAPAALIVPEAELATLAAGLEYGGGTWIDHVCGYGDSPGAAAGAVLQALQHAGLSTACYATDDARTAGWLTERGAENSRFVFRPSLFSEIRLVKSAAEIDLLKLAAHVNEMGLLLAADSMAVGSTRDELENLYMMTMAQQGGRGVHMRAGGTDQNPFVAQRDVATALKALGTWRHYHGCIGRTAVVGEPDKVQRRHHAHLLAGWETATEQFQPGVSYAGVSRAVGDTVRAAGLPNFRDPLVHSVGLERMDDPRAFGAPPNLQPDPEQLLQPDMVVAIAMSHAETGQSSLRIEDTVRITAYGHERLSKSDFSILVSEPTD